MAAVGPTLVANGYRVLPIQPGTKMPGGYSNGTWHNLYEWQKRCDRDTSQYEVDIWSRWHGCAVGIAAGNVVGIDIDVMDAAVSHELTELAYQMLGRTPAVRIGKHPKVMLIYRAETPFSGRKMRPVEVLGRGQQFLAYATHPDTGQPYTWPEDGLIHLDRATLPETTETAALAYLRAAYAKVPAHLRPATLADTTQQSEWRGVSDPKGTLAAITSALAYIPNDDLEGASWVRMGNCLKAALGEDGRELWLDWSQSSNKSGASGKSDTAEKRWKSFRPRDVGAGTIYYLAEQRGWKPPDDVYLNEQKAERARDFAENIDPAQAMWDRQEAFLSEKNNKAVNEVPHGVLEDAGGLLADFVDYATTTALHPQPFLALGAALCLIATAAGRRYAGPTRRGTSLMVAALAPSGSGKNAPLKCISNVLRAASLERYLGGGALSSGQSILSALADHPVKLFMMDEFGHKIAATTGRNASSHESSIMSILTELYTATDVQVQGKDYANTKEHKRVDLCKPHLILYGTTVPEILWSAFQNGSLKDGSLARMLVIKSPDPHPELNYESLFVPSSPPAALVAAIESIARGPEGYDFGGNLQNIEVMDATLDITPYPIPFGNGAFELWKRYKQIETDKLQSIQDEGQKAFISRLCEHIVNVATIRAIAREHQSPVIEVEDLQWGNLLVEFCLTSAMKEAGKNVSDNIHEQQYKKVIKLIEDSGKDGMTRTDFYKLTNFLGNKKTRDDMLNILEESRQIAIEKIEGKTKPTTMIKYIGGAKQ